MMKSQTSKLAFLMAFFLILLNVIFPVTAIAVSPWSGTPWEGHEWEGNEWNGQDWSGNEWEGQAGTGNPWENPSWYDKDASEIKWHIDGSNRGAPFEDTLGSDINSEIDKTIPPSNQIGLIERSHADLIFTGIGSGFKSYFDGVPAVMSLKHGYQFDINNPNAYFDYSVRGKRSASMGSNWEQAQFDRYRGIELNSQGGIQSATGGMNKGNIHMERMATDLVYANKHTLIREFNPFRSGWMRDSVRGGRPGGHRIKY